ncbi:myotubularin-related protein 9-like isoform X1 [Crotalus tigris]|uniref:myotubularin-related protein 9-like isoform X1 n=2 Tax=Crotalus tigris TaxID=88082 RepID=UPI00192F5294|nr:myotubularin-related protein 9-like isoform X1 [Crotalus tigris]XP_039185245.1 myotubularin-related protein 9-like isoform X1 [Crotalus tigris]
MEFAELIKTTKVDDVVLSCPGLQPIRGTLAITSHHLLFSSQTEGSEEHKTTELWLLIRSVDAIEKSIQNLSWYQSSWTNSSLTENRLANASGTITLKCKDLKILQLEIPGMAECLNIASSIEALSSLESVMMTYPFFYRPQNTTLGTGWLTHITEQYYEQIATDTGAWRLSSINADFGVCPSYPPVVIVPARLDDGALQKSARFRQGRRFPVLSYYHKKNGTAMLRSSQPLVGPNRKRCYEDEQLLTTILEGGDRGFILDTRSLQAAKQARVMGGGLEHRSCYRGWKRLHRALERGRSLQESFIKLVEACNDPSPHMDRWLSRLEASKWLSHVKEALNAACLAAQCLEREEACVLVHGAEGKDATLLVTALAQVILDPACRTLAGFQGLLEREWIQAGHPFQLRCAHSAYAHARLKQEAPTFLLFLDCVWQLGRQFPFSLAFNEHLLLALFEHCYASPYGTFLGNNEKERRLCDVRGKTHCLWPWINRVEKYLNPLYLYNPLVIWPSVEPQSVVLWQGLFLHWVRSSHHLDEAWAEIQQIATNSQTYSQQLHRAM